MRAALQEGVRRRGAAIVRGRGRLRESKRRRWSVELEDDGARLDADVVVCATGAWTYAWADDAGATPAVYPQRGQILHLELPATSTGDWPMIIGFGSHYMLTFPESRVVAGATREDQAGWDYRVTAAGQLELLREAFRVAPGLLDATLVETRVGFRPATRDGMPLLGRAPGIENGVIATGLGPSGLTLGPYIGHLAAGLAAGREPPLDISAFDPGRHLGV
jgi:D-amino-acid dehydrogenase